MSTHANTEQEIQEIKELFCKYYSPADFNDQPFLFMTTRMIYNSLYSVYPKKHFSPDIVASWLIEYGFKTCNTGGMDIQWIVKENF